jgi:hypothetical protein
MEYTYEIITAKNASTLKRTDTNGEVTWIPINEANSDYQRYLNPEAEQSTPNLPIGGSN